MLSSILPFQDDEEDESYDVQSLFTNILIQETTTSLNKFMCIKS